MACDGNRTLPTRQLAYSLDSSLAGCHVVYALIQLYMYSKYSVVIMDMAAVVYSYGDR